MLIINTTDASVSFNYSDTSTTISKVPKSSVTCAIDSKTEIILFESSKHGILFYGKLGDIKLNDIILNINNYVEILDKIFIESKVINISDVEGLNSRLDGIDTKISELEENSGSGGGGNITLPIEIADVKDLDIKISELQQENGILKSSLMEMEIKIQELENIIQQMQ